MGCTSGTRLDLSGIGRPVVDKHSTGGVGDKVTLVLGPLVASCGAYFGKMSGRGLGHTGGTIDKLESIPGLRTTLDAGTFRRQLAATGICVAGQSRDLAPADDRMYALRDVTATVESNPLVAASIISKKLAGGSSAVVFDIKVGSGSFFRNKGQAHGVEHLLKEVGERRGLAVETVMSSMEQPLGNAVGNSLEVLEAARTLAGGGPADLVEVVVALASKLLPHAGLGWNSARAGKEARARLAQGTALVKFREWIEAQSGDASFIDDPGALTAAGHRISVRATASGWVESIDALAVGRAVLGLGAGRRVKEDVIDHAVGAVLHQKSGGRVEEGQEIATVHASSRGQGLAAADAILSAYRISSEEVEPAPVLVS